jgi:hypothetical protein
LELASLARPCIRDNPIDDPAAAARFAPVTRSKSASQARHVPQEEGRGHAPGLSQNGAFIGQFPKEFGVLEKNLFRNAEMLLAIGATRFGNLPATFETNT